MKIEVDLDNVAQGEIARLKKNLSAVQVKAERLERELQSWRAQKTAIKKAYEAIRAFYDEFRWIGDWE